MGKISYWTLFTPPGMKRKKEISRKIRFFVKHVVHNDKNQDWVVVKSMDRYG